MIEYKNLFHKLRKSSLILNLSSIVSCRIINVLIGLITFGYAARVLGAEMYGLVGFGASIVAYAGIVTLPGITIWGTRSVATDKQNIGKTLLIVNSTILLMTCFAYAGLVFFSLTLNNPMEKKIVLLSGISLFSTALSLEWVFNGLEQMRIPAYLSIIQTSLFTITLISLVKSPADVYIFPLLMPGASLIVVIISYVIFLKKSASTYVLPKFPDYKKALRAAIALGIMASMVTILHFANNLIVNAYLGLLSLGVFWAAFKLIEQISAIPAILGSIFYARLARFVIDDKEKAKMQAIIFAQINMITGFFVAAYLVAEANEIIRLIYGSKYLDSVRILQIMAVAVIFNFAIHGYTNCLIPFRKDHILILVVIIETIVSVAGGIICVSYFGLIGAAFAVAFIDFAGWLVSLPAYKKIIGDVQIHLWIKPMLGFLCMIGTLLGLQYLGAPVYFRLPVSVIIYVIFIKEDLKNIMSLLAGSSLQYNLKRT